MEYKSNRLLSKYQLPNSTLHKKLDGVATLMTDSPPTNFTSFKKKIKIKN
jgi:hypothetical protein